MSLTGQVHWHEGLFLQPHHLQAMQHLALDGTGSERRLAWLYPYGLIEAKLSPDALENMLIRFDRLRLIMPSGLEVNFPDNADLPSLDISQPFAASSSSFNINLAVPLWYPNRANSIEPGGEKTASSDHRVKRLYRVMETQRPDENTGENPQPMMLRRINARLILDDDDHTDLEVLPLLRIACHGRECRPAPAGSRVHPAMFRRWRLGAAARDAPRSVQPDPRIAYRTDAAIGPRGLHG